MAAGFAATLVNELKRANAGALLLADNGGYDLQQATVTRQGQARTGRASSLWREILVL
ncbi:hypothetical protein BH10PSE4_BH10PSE4_32790 [soil metagenome]